MITYNDLDKFGKRKNGISFTMVFENGSCLDGCLHQNTTDTDEEIIRQCNATNPEKWGKVVSIKDKVETIFWALVSANRSA